MSAIRQQLRDKITARLQLIVAGATVILQHSGKVHTFVTDIGASVIPWRVGDVLPKEMPCTGFADQDADAGYEGADNSEQAHGLNIEIVGFVGGDDHVSQATSALLDILAAVGSDPEWDGLARAYTSLTGTEIEIHPDGRKIAAATVRIRIDYYSPLWEV